MTYEKGVDFEDLETKNWNVAKPYTTEKILKWLVAIDTYQTIATFGYSNIESDVFIRDNNLKNTARLYAMKRLIHAIISLIRNTKFAIKKSDKVSFDNHMERLYKIEKHLQLLRLEKKRGTRIVELDVNENLFEKIMDELNTIMDDVNFKLNSADLIFTHTDEYDPKKIKEGYKQKYINRG